MEHLTQIYEIALSLLIIYWPYALLGLLFYLFNELEDESIKNHWTGKREVWNTENSWVNKWAAPWPQPYVKRWYHFGVHPKFKERFPYSSTFLVFSTDAEHAFQFIKFRLIEIMLFIVSWQIAVVYITGKNLASLSKEKFIKWLK
jgi:hypothetical protein